MWNRRGTVEGRGSWGLGWPKGQVVLVGWWKGQRMAAMWIGRRSMIGGLSVTTMAVLRAG